MAVEHSLAYSSPQGKAPVVSAIGSPDMLLMIMPKTDFGLSQSQLAEMVEKAGFSRVRQYNMGGNSSSASMDLGTLVIGDVHFLFHLTPSANDDSFKLDEVLKSRPDLELLRSFSPDILPLADIAQELGAIFATPDAFSKQALQKLVETIQTVIEIKKISTVIEQQGTSPALQKRLDLQIEKLITQLNQSLDLQVLPKNLMTFSIKLIEKTANPLQKSQITTKIAASLAVLKTKESQALSSTDLKKIVAKTATNKALPPRIGQAIQNGLNSLSVSRSTPIPKGAALRQTAIQTKQSKAALSQKIMQAGIALSQDIGKISLAIASLPANQQPSFRKSIRPLLQQVTATTAVLQQQPMSLQTQVSLQQTIRVLEKTTALPVLNPLTTPMQGLASSHPLAKATNNVNQILKTLSEKITGLSAVHNKALVQTTNLPPVAIQQATSAITSIQKATALIAEKGSPAAQAIIQKVTALAQQPITEQAVQTFQQIQSYLQFPTNQTTSLSVQAGLEIPKVQEQITALINKPHSNNQPLVQNEGKELTSLATPNHQTTHETQQKPQPTIESTKNLRAPDPEQSSTPLSIMHKFGDCCSPERIIEKNNVLTKIERGEGYTVSEITTAFADVIDMNKVTPEKIEHFVQTAIQSKKFLQEMQRDGLSVIDTSQQSFRNKLAYDFRNFINSDKKHSGHVCSPHCKHD